MVMPLQPMAPVQRHHVQLPVDPGDEDGRKEITMSKEKGETQIKARIDGLKAVQKEFGWDNNSTKWQVRAAWELGEALKLIQQAPCNRGAAKSLRLKRPRGVGGSLTMAEIEKTRITIWEVTYGENMSRDWIVAANIDEALAKSRKQIQEGLPRGKKAAEEWLELNEPTQIERMGRTDA